MDDIKIGDWYAYCCEEDLTQIRNQEDLESVVDAIEEDACPPVVIARTKEEALRKLNG